MKTVFIGCVYGSKVFLETLIKCPIEISGVITMQESKFNSDFFDLSVIAKEHNISWIYTKDINALETIEFVRKIKPDIIFCLGWSRLLKKDLLSVPRLGVVGFHPAELPYNRGRHPLIWALVLGLQSTASSFFIMDETADTGKLISQQKVIIKYEDYASDLYTRVLQIACKQIEEIVDSLNSNKLVFLTKLNAKGNIWRKRGYYDGLIDWRMASYSIYNLIRALSHPYIGADFKCNGVLYKAWKSKENFDFSENNIEPGKILKVFDNTHFIIKTGTNAIEVLDCDTIDLTTVEYLKE